MISREVIEERKENLSEDIVKIKNRITEMEEKKKEDIALLNAMTGAYQQCEFFLQKLDDEKSDDGVVD